MCESPAHFGKTIPGLNKNSSWESQGQQASKHHSPIVCAPVPVSKLRLWVLVPALLGEELQPVSQTSPFLPKLLVAYGVYHSKRKATRWSTFLRLWSWPSTLPECSPTNPASLYCWQPCLMDIPRLLSVATAKPCADIYHPQEWEWLSPTWEFYFWL